MTKLLMALLSAALAGSATDLYRHEWRHTTPVIRSEGHKLTSAEADGLLRGFCVKNLRTVPKIGLECTTRNLGKAFRDIIDNTFHPESVMYGNFLAPESEDAAVNGWSAEHHPELWRGTLLLKKRNGRWAAVWYRSSVITHSCRKLLKPDKREVLLCEEEDGGMGHRLHYLYSVELKRPRDIRDEPLFAADSYDSSCVVQRQRIVTADWDQAAQVLSVRTSVPAWRRLSREACAGDPPDGAGRPQSGAIMFELTDDGFRQAPRQADR